MQVLSIIAGFLLMVSYAFAQETSERQRFNDVYESNKHRIAIEWMADQGIVKGYADGSFRGDRTVNRAEALKMIVTSASGSNISSCTKSFFADVAKSEWYAPYVCVATERKWIALEGEKPLFRPSETMNMGELSVLLARVYDLSTEKSDPWYASAIRALGEKDALSPDIEAAGQSVSRAQLAEFLWRLETDPDPVLSANAEDLLAAKCDWQPDHDIPSVDDQEVARTWMKWVNTLRIDNGLEPYRIDRQLMRTAQEWSDHANAAGSISHTRPGQTVYYDYGIMTNWFSKRDLTFENDHSSTFTENIGWGVYTCSEADCTQKLINALRTTFDFYMSEKNKASRPHYNSMINSDFKLAGIGLTIDQSTGRYFFVAHYGTAITSKPDPICP